MNHKISNYPKIAKLFNLKAKAKREYVEEVERHRKDVMLRKWDIIRYQR